jgi:ketosteroid isomerase-like protein
VKMKFASTSVDVSRSGDLALQRATFQVETTDKDGKPATETGQAVVVWRKQADGSWKVVADTNADDK